MLCELTLSCAPSSYPREARPGRCDGPGEIWAYRAEAVTNSLTAGIRLTPCSKSVVRLRSACRMPFARPEAPRRRNPGWSSGLHPQPCDERRTGEGLRSSAARGLDRHSGLLTRRRRAVDPYDFVWSLRRGLPDRKRRFEHRERTRSRSVGSAPFDESASTTC